MVTNLGVGFLSLIVRITGTDLACAPDSSLRPTIRTLKSGDDLPPTAWGRVADRAVLPAEVMLRRRQQGANPRSPGREERP